MAQLQKDMIAYRENEHLRKLNKNSIMQFVQSFNQKKSEEKALEKDMAKKEELEFEVNNLEAPMISEME